jgi:putative FmdB family regulatory protein
MPIYEYICVKCKEEFSVYQSVNANEKDVKCPKCESSDIKKKVSTFSCCSVSNSFSSGSFGGFGGG